MNYLLSIQSELFYIRSVRPACNLFSLLFYRSFNFLSDVLDDICRLFVLADFRNIAIIMFTFISKVQVKGQTEDFNYPFSNYDMTVDTFINTKPESKFK